MKYIVVKFQLTGRIVSFWLTGESFAIQWTQNLFFFSTMTIHPPLKWNIDKAKEGYSEIKYSPQAVRAFYKL